MACLPQLAAADGGPVSVTEQKLLAADGASMDKFGHSVSISGNFAIVGAYGADGMEEASGAAYILFHDGTSWLEMQKLTASDGSALDKFGHSVAISGNEAFIGAPGDNANGQSAGSVYIFSYDGTTWSQRQKVAPVSGSSWEKFGQSVALAGNYAIIGAWGDNFNGESSGSAYVFYNNGSNWQEMQKLTPSDGAGWSKFGYSVSLSGNSAIVGAPGDDTGAGSAGSSYVYYFDGTSWSLEQKLVATDGAGWDKFGESVSIFNDSLVVGAPGDDDKGSSSGSSYIYYFDGTGWVLEQKINADDGAAADYFGQSVSISGDSVIIGASGDDDKGVSSGAVYIYNFDGTSWSLAQKMVSIDGESSDYQGQSVFISGDYALCGSLGDDDKGESSGSVTLFADFNPNNTLQGDQNEDSDVDGLDVSSFALQVSSGTNTLDLAVFAAEFGL